MSKKNKNKRKLADSIRLDPEKRLVNKFDSVSIAKFPIADASRMGFRVKDDCAEEHIM